MCDVIRLHLFPRITLWFSSVKFLDRFGHGGVGGGEGHEGQISSDPLPVKYLWEAAVSNSNMDRDEPAACCVSMIVL